MSKSERNRLIQLAHEQHGYLLEEISQCLSIHYTTVSRVINKVESSFFKT